MDFALINECRAEDIIITQDYGVAAMALGKEPIRSTKAASVHEASRKLVDVDSPRLFHFLLQEFVDPLYALRKLKKTDDAWIFRCDLPERTRKSPKCSKFSVKAYESKLYAVDSSRNKEYAISFRDKSLYYIITPLVAAGAAQADVNTDGNRLHLFVKDNSFRRDYKTANAIIQSEIWKLR